MDVGITRKGNSLRGGYLIGRTLFSSRIRVIAAALILLRVCSFALADANSARPAKRVLILYSFDNEEALYAGFDRVLRTQLRSNSPERVELYTEYLDLVRFPGPEHAKDLVKLLQIKFLHQPPDLVIPVSYAALSFLLGEGKGLFHGTPIVALFNASLVEVVKQKISDGGRQLPLTGVASTDEPTRTLDFALRLQPDTRQVAVLVGSSPGEQRWLEELRHEFAPYQNKIAVTYLAGLPMPELLRQVTTLPPHTVVLSTFFFEDGSG